MATTPFTPPVDCAVLPDKSKCRDKSVIITGGANGIGEAYVRAFAENGAFVTFCDVNEERGKTLEAELTTSRVCFVKCDTRSWEDQVLVFENAVSKSPRRSVDIVIANAGVGRGSGDPMMALEDPFQPPTKPSMHIIDINLIGVMYSFKLAAHYFRRCPLDDSRDRCFVFGGSIVGYSDNLRSWEYSTSKWGLRGLMRTIRRSSHHQGIRVAYIAPSYVRTAIQGAQVFEAMKAAGVELATTDSCVAAAMRIVCDKSINGHSFAIMPNSEVKEGFRDIDEDNYTSHSAWLLEMQEKTIRLRGDEWQ